MIVYAFRPLRCYWLAQTDGTMKRRSKCQFSCRLKMRFPTEQVHCAIFNRIDESIIFGSILPKNGGKPGLLHVFNKDLNFPLTAETILAQLGNR
jgi:hypothetical protein